MNTISTGVEMNDGHDNNAFQRNDNGRRTDDKAQPISPKSADWCKKHVYAFLGNLAADDPTDQCGFQILPIYNAKDVWDYIFKYIPEKFKRERHGVWRR